MITVPYVDEDPIMCSLVSRILEKTGDIVVHSLVSGEEALALPVFFPQIPWMPGFSRSIC